MLAGSHRTSPNPNLDPRRRSPAIVCSHSSQPFLVILMLVRAELVNSLPSFLADPVAASPPLSAASFSCWILRTWAHLIGRENPWRCCRCHGGGATEPKLVLFRNPRAMVTQKAQNRLTISYKNTRNKGSLRLLDFSLSTIQIPCIGLPSPSQIMSLWKLLFRPPSYHAYHSRESSPLLA